MGYDTFINHVRQDEVNIIPLKLVSNDDTSIPITLASYSDLTISMARHGLPGRISPSSGYLIEHGAGGYGLELKAELFSVPGYGILYASGSVFETAIKPLEIHIQVSNLSSKIETLYSRIDQTLTTLSTAITNAITAHNTNIEAKLASGTIQIDNNINDTETALKASTASGTNTTSYNITVSKVALQASIASGTSTTETNINDTETALKASIASGTTTTANNINNHNITITALLESSTYGLEKIKEAISLIPNAEQTASGVWNRNASGCSANSAGKLMWNGLYTLLGEIERSGLNLLYKDKNDNTVVTQQSGANGNRTVI